MIQVEKIKFENPLQNYSYLVNCDGLIFCIDPFDGKECFMKANDLGWDISYLLNTHSHYDHISGNEALTKLSGARVVEANEYQQFSFFESIFTPGHSPDHYAFLFRSEKNSFFFSGDLIFDWGIGNTRLPGADIVDFYKSVETIKTKIPKGAFFYPGHYYFESNYRFSCKIKNQELEEKQSIYFKDELKNNLFLNVKDMDEFIHLRKLRDNF